MHNMAERKPFESGKSIPPPENNQDAFEKLELENQNLKREIEELKSQRDKMGADKVEMELELQRERKNTDNSQQLVDELNRKSETSSKYPTTGSLPANDEITRVVREKSGLEKQLSEEISKIDHLTSELNSTKEQLEMQTKTLREVKEENAKTVANLNQEYNEKKAELIDLELKFGELQNNYNSLSQERETMSQKMEDVKQSPLESKRRQSEPGRKPEKIEVQRGLSEVLPPILDLEREETGHNAGDELVAAKIHIRDLQTHLRSLETQKEETNLQEKRLELKLRELQGVNEELNEAKKKNQELGNSNYELRKELNRVNDALLEKENINEELQIRMELSETQELIKEAARHDPSPEFEQDICEVEPHRNAPRPIKHHQNPQDYSSPPTPSREECPTDQLFYSSPDVRENPITPYQDPSPTHSLHKIPHNVDIASPLTSGYSVKVTVTWRKQTPTLEREITYFDNNQEQLPTQLAWVAADELFQGTGDFKMGQHHGSIHLNDKMHEIQPFIVSKDMETIMLNLADVIGADAVPW